MPMKVVPLELREANDFVAVHHRHHGQAQGHRFSLGVVDDDGELHACAIVGRPTSGLDPKRLLEVTRMCSDGTKNACSMLYGAVARAAKAMGFEAVQTYIFKDEDGASLKASGWAYVRDAHPSGRHRKRSDGQNRDITHQPVVKTLWRKQFIPGELRPFRHHRMDPKAPEVIQPNIWEEAL